MVHILWDLWSSFDCDPFREREQTDRFRSLTLLLAHIFRDDQGIVPRCYWLSSMMRPLSG